MQDIVSPYELLKACRPKQPETLITPYDLYSAAQTASAQAQLEPDRAYMPAEEPPQPVAPYPAYVPDERPIRRTHYIADIQSRHNQAAHRVSRGH